MHPCMARSTNTKHQPELYRTGHQLSSSFGTSSMPMRPQDVISLIHGYVVGDTTVSQALKDPNESVARILKSVVRESSPSEMILFPSFFCNIRSHAYSLLLQALTCIFYSSPSLTHTLMLVNRLRSKDCDKMWRSIIETTGEQYVL